MAVTAPISADIQGNVHQHVAVFQSSAAADGKRFDLMRGRPGDVILAVQMTVQDAGGSQVDVGYDFDNTANATGQAEYFMSDRTISSTGYQDSRAETFHRPLVFTDFGHVTMHVEGAAITSLTRLIFHVLYIRRVIA